MSIIIFATSAAMNMIARTSIFSSFIQAEKILDFTDEHGCDPIVVGLLGKKGIERFAIRNLSKKL